MASINFTMARRVSFAIPHVTPALQSYPPLAPLVLLGTIARIALPADLPAQVHPFTSVTLISGHRPAKHAQAPAYIALKQKVTATSAVLFNITNLTMIIATPLAPVSPDIMLLLLKGDVFHAEILTAYLAVAVVIASLASHSGTSIHTLDAAREGVQQAAPNASLMELAIHASLGGPSTTTAKLALAHLRDAVNVVLLNVALAKKVRG